MNRVGELHARCRRRGQIPAGHGVLYRREGLRQDRANGVLQAGPDRAVGQRRTGFPCPGLGYFSGGYECSGEDPIEVSAFTSRGTRRSALESTNRRGPRTRTTTRSATRWKGRTLTFFDIVASTGELLTKQLFMEVETTFTITIKATDPSGDVRHHQGDHHAIRRQRGPGRRGPQKDQIPRERHLAGGRLHRPKPARRRRRAG